MLTPVALFCVKFDGETTDIANSIGGSPATENSRESRKDRRCTGRVGEDTSRGDIGSGFKESKFAKGAGATGVDDTLWDTFVIETVDLKRLASGSMAIS